MRVAMMLYDGAEPLDIAPFGVFSMARRRIPEVSTYTVAERVGLIVLANGLKVWADYSFVDAPPAEILIVPGGQTWEQQARSQGVLEFVRSFGQRSLVASVCSGGMILAASGLLDGRSATTRRGITRPGEVPPLELMRERHRTIKTVEARLIDSGTVLTGGGVTLCIDMALYLIERFFGAQTALEVAESIEYSAALEANRARLPTVMDKG